jgi:hypothetical protein
LIAIAIAAGLAMSTKYSVASVAIPALWAGLWPDRSIKQFWFGRLKQFAGYLVPDCLR